MDRFTVVARIYKPNESRSNKNWRMVDRFKLKRSDPCFVPVGYTYDLSDNEIPRYHTSVDYPVRDRRLNDGHLKAWIETNYMQVVIEYEAANLIAITPWIFKAWVRVRYSHLLKRFAAFNERRIKEYEAK